MKFVGSNKNSLFILVPSFSFVFLSIYFFGSADYDLFARVAVGRLIISSWQVPLIDPFAYTKTKEIWYDHEWLSGVSFYLTSQIGNGDSALLILTAFVALLTLFFIVQSNKVASVDMALLSAWLFLLTAPSTLIWNNIIRSHVFTFLFFAFQLYAFRRYRKQQSLASLLWLPFIYIFWINSHAGFVIGFCTWIIFICSTVLSDKKIDWFLLSCFFATFLTVFFNPYGLGFLQFVIEAVNKDRILINEWDATDIFSLQQSLLWFVGFVCWRELFLRKKHLPLEAYLLLIFTTYLALRYQRLVPFFYITAGAFYLPAFQSFCHFLAEKLFPLWIRLKGSFQLLLRTTTIVGLAVFLYFIFTLKSYSLDYSEFPVSALRWLESQNTKGKILVHFNDGSYVLWRGYPNLRVSLDGRYEEVYPDATVEAVHAAFDVNHPKHEVSFKQVMPDYILICAHSAPGLAPSNFGLQWNNIYSDGDCTILKNELFNSSSNSSSHDENWHMWRPRF